MPEQTPAEFARKLRRLPGAVESASPRGLEARALVTKKFILTAAFAASRMARPNWVRYRMADAIAEVRLRGGFAHLAERGSYKKPEGWDESPKKQSARAKRLAARNPGLTLRTPSAALNTPFGPKASVHHPALTARPFWKAGVEASRRPGFVAYRRAEEEAILSVFR